MAHFIYAEELTSLGHGYPLWEPDEVAIADVGYIHYGAFCRLFNASLPRGHPQNQQFGEPEGYEPLDIGAILDRAPHPAGVMVSRSVSKKGADVEISGSIVETGAGFEFACMKDRGAVLIINSEAHRKDTLRLLAFKKYMIKHHASWLRLANNELNARDISLNDLVFVTGRDNTADWAVATFSERSVSGGVFFEAGYPTIAGAKFSIWGSWRQTRSVHSHCGPKIDHSASPANAIHPVCAADLQKYNQCVFLRGFKMLDKRARARKGLRLKAKSSSGGLEELPEPWFQRTSSGDLSDASSTKGRPIMDGSSSGKQYTQFAGESTPEATDVEIVSNDPQGSAPLDSLLAYVLENSKAELAIAHDNDLADVIEACTDPPDPSDFGVMIRDAFPRVHVNSQGVGMIFDKSLETPRVTHLPPSINPDRAVEHSSPEGSGLSSPTVGPGESYPPPPLAMDIILEKQRLKQASLPMEAAGLKKSTRPISSKASSGRNHNIAVLGKPDSAAYNAEQQRIKSEIDVLQVQLSTVQGQVALTSKTGPRADRRNALRAELDTLRDQHLASKTYRGATATELKRVQEETRKKIKDLQTLSKNLKLPARTTEELDSQIRSFERRVDGGTMSLPEEKKVLGQITSLRRSRSAVENYQKLQSAIDADRTRADALRKQLNIGTKAISDRIDAVRAELDSLRKDSDGAFANRGKLWDERNALQTHLSLLHDQKRQSAERFREEREAYWRKVSEERATQAERVREERAAIEEHKRIQAQERLLEKARVPAFTAEIHDCRSLLEYFSAFGKADHGTTSISPTGPSKQSLRQPEENHPGAGWVPLKKKEEESYFVGGKGKARKGQRKGASAPAKISVPLGILSTLLSLSIAPPSVAADVPKTTEDLHKKIEWFEANQKRATEENVARTEAHLQRIAPPTRTNSVSLAA